MKLFTRYNRISLPIILGIFLISGVCCYFWIGHILIKDFDESLGEQAQKISLYVKANGVFPKPGLTDESLFRYQKIDEREVAPHYETIRQYDEEDKENSKYRALSYSYKVAGSNYLLRISKPLEGLEGLSRSIAMITMLTLLAVIIATLLLSHFVLRKLWQPFYKALELLQDFKLGKQKTIVFVKTRTEEFDFMNAQLDSMIRNAEKEYILLKEFTENASHEMQTPLSIIRSKLDMIVQENLSKQQSQALESAYDSVRRLTTLGQSLLLLSKIENNQFNNKIRIDLEGKIKNKILELQEFWLEKKIIVNFNAKQAYITVNADLIDILLNNIFSNASRHNIKKGIIEITLNKQELIVSNTGINMPIDPARIYSRFYKQQQHSTHNGLGLAIIKQICDQSHIAVKYTFTNEQHTFSFTW